MGAHQAPAEACGHGRAHSAGPLHGAAASLKREVVQIQDCLGEVEADKLPECEETAPAEARGHSRIRERNRHICPADAAGQAL